MTKDEKLSALKAWQVTMEKSDALFEPIIEAMQLVPESPACEAVWLLQAELTTATSARIGDHWDNLSWYALENNFGKGEREAGPHGKMRKICTLKDLLWLVEVAP